MSGETFVASIGSQRVELPVVPLTGDLSIALLITVDLPIEFCERAGRELAAALSDRDVEVVASIATMGIPVAVEVARSLRHDGYVVFHKTPKIHLSDALSEPVRSITTATAQRLYLDRARATVLRGRRVALVDDVISTGASVAAALRLIRRVGGEPVAVGALATEGSAWREALGDDAPLVRALGRLPLFSPLEGGGVTPRDD